MVVATAGERLLASAGCRPAAAHRHGPRGTPGTTSWNIRLMEYLVLALVGLLLLGGLISFGAGHARWNWGTVTAGILVLLTGTGFLYLASRVAQRERAWGTRVADYERRLDRAAYGVEPGPDGRPVDGRDGGSLDDLAATRDRLRQAYDLASVWKGRTWPEAAFQPPRDADSTGEIELPPDGNAADNPPLGPGAIIYVFDAAAFEDGGRYLGQFVVKGSTYDQRGSRHVLTVAATAPPDAYAAEVLAGDHEDVIVFEELPVSNTAIAPDEWDAVITEVRAGTAPPNAYGALVRLMEPLRLALTDGGNAEDFNTGDLLELELSRALEVAAPDGAPDVATTAVIEGIILRRPVLDFTTQLHGARVTAGGATVFAGGLDERRRLLETRIRDLARVQLRLESAIRDAETTLERTRATEGRLTEDMAGWTRDVEASERLTNRFEAEKRHTDAALEETEGLVVELGAELTRALASLAAEVDRASPAPGR